MGKWGLVKIVEKAVRPDDSRIDERESSKGLERPRKDQGNEPGPRPGRPSPYQSQSDPGPQHGGQPVYPSTTPYGLMSPPQLPPRQDFQTQYNTPYNPQNYGTSHPDTYPLQAPTHPSTYGSNQNQYTPAASNHVQQTSPRPSMSPPQGYPNYPYQPSGGQNPQNYHNRQSQYPTQAGASSIGQDWYSQTSYPNYGQNSPPLQPGIGSSSSPPPGPPYPSQTTFMPEPCEHGSYDDGSCRKCRRKRQDQSRR